MAKRLYADVPKFKSIELKLRQVVAAQQDVAALMQSAKANEHERRCLDQAHEECEQAIRHMRQAVQRLYDAFDPPEKR